MKIITTIGERHKLIKAAVVLRAYHEHHIDVNEIITGTDIAIRNFADKGPTACEIKQVGDVIKLKQKSFTTRLIKLYNACDFSKRTSQYFGISL